MKYMLLIYGPETSWTKQEWIQCTVDSSAICHELAAKGQFIAAAPLYPVATATSVRIRDGKRLITDGPFAETTEQLGGYYIIDVADLDAAIAVASRLPPAKKGTVEIRPIYELPAIAIPDACEIMNSRDLPLLRADVFKAFENPDRLARWWGPNGFSSTFQQFEFRDGGAWRHVMHGPDGKDYPNESVFAEIDAPQRVVVNHLGHPKFVLTITLDELPGDKTRIVWRMRFATVELRNEVARYAVKCNEENFDRLVAEVQSHG